MANILILGGTAWLGRTLAAQAMEAGHAVTCLARGKSGDFPKGMAAIEVDRDGDGAYAGAVSQQWDLVVELTRMPAHARAAVEALSPRARHWIFVSSCSVYADHSTPEVPEEAELLEPLESTETYTPELYGQAKSGCEWLAMATRGNAALVVRPGLIGGPGDPSGRTTYWPLRLADPRGPVLVPLDDGSAYRQHVQLIDVRDLAAFILDAGLAGRTGAVNAVGQAVPLQDALLAAREAAHANPQIVPYRLSTMVADGVSPWSGPRSLPLVLPLEADYAGFARRSDARALEWGLERRPLEETFRDIIACEEPWAGRQLGAGLSAADEGQLIDIARSKAV
ncbi:oxidoreductase [Arthrobacter livingstonensis]|uniref:Oxidoreductase n=1 Tax=Arthrobacter livingstonensis TaxID=670078 RepID=A0A2V5LAV7_9MICC|nr:NAD-dependent epimerase/dehydratase family protein [Arthrobacter livingstonensis]PYI67922.1 oxidoreductase [Arthrobacter livingstonensis]